MKGIGQVEKITQDLPAMLARNAFRMKLYAERRAVSMLDPHDEAIIALGADLELGRRARSLDDQRVIARRSKRAVQAAEEPARIVRDARHFAVHRRGARTTSPPNACPIA